MRANDPIPLDAVRRLIKKMTIKQTKNQIILAKTAVDNLLFRLVFKLFQAEKTRNLIKKKRIFGSKNKANFLNLKILIHTRRSRDFCIGDLKR